MPALVIRLAAVAHMTASPCHAQPLDELLREDLPKGSFCDTHPVVLLQHVDNGLEQLRLRACSHELYLQLLDPLLRRKHLALTIHVHSSDRRQAPATQPRATMLAQPHQHRQSTLNPVVPLRLLVRQFAFSHLLDH